MFESHRLDPAWIARRRAGDAFRDAAVLKAIRDRISGSTPNDRRRSADAGAMHFREADAARQADCRRSRAARQRMIARAGGWRRSRACRESRAVTDYCIARL